MSYPYDMSGSMESPHEAAVLALLQPGGTDFNPALSELMARIQSQNPPNWNRYQLVVTDGDAFDNGAHCDAAMARIREMLADLKDVRIDFLDESGAT